MITSETKNICLFNTCKTWGGGEKWHHDIALKFFEKGYKVIVCTNNNSELYHRLKHTPIPLFQIKIRNLSFLDPFKIIRAYQIFRKYKIDTLILGLPSDVKTAGFSAKLAGIRKIIYRRGTALPLKNSFLNRIIFKYIVTDVITNSIEIKKKFLERNPKIFPDNNIHVIYNGIELNSNGYHPQQRINGHHKQVVLGNAGRLVEQKGQKYLIELAAILAAQHIDFKIMIAGKGILKDTLIAYARKLKVEDKIEFLDFMYDMSSFFRTIDIFLLPSLHEGSANIVLEAMYHAKPVVAFNVSSMPEMIEDKKTGYLVEFNNINDFADKVIHLIQNYTFRKEMGENARNRVLVHFDLNKNICHLEQIIN